MCSSGNEPIRSVLCPGLGTAVGRMPAERCAHQVMRNPLVFCVLVQGMAAYRYMGES